MYIELEREAIATCVFFLFAGKRSKAELSRRTAIATLGKTRLVRWQVISQSGRMEGKAAAILYAPGRRAPPSVHFVLSGKVIVRL